MNAKKLLWLLPFLCFLLTYAILHKIFTKSPFLAPSVVGKQLPEALNILAHHTLNTRLSALTENNDVPEGTVLNQHPLAHNSIRPHQTVFLTISKRQERMIAPDLAHLSRDGIATLLEKHGISAKWYELSSPLPRHHCIAQIPHAHELLEEDKRMIVYISSGEQKPVILPSFKGMYVDEVMQFLESHGVKTTIFHAKGIAPNHICSSCTVLEQKPLAGSFIDLQKPLTVYLYVQ